MEDLEYSRQILFFLKSKPIVLDDVKYLIINSRGLNKGKTIYQYELECIDMEMYQELRDKYEEMSNDEFFEHIFWNQEEILQPMTLTFNKDRSVFLDNKNITQKLKVYLRKEKMKKINLEK